MTVCVGGCECLCVSVSVLVYGLKNVYCVCASVARQARTDRFNNKLIKSTFETKEASKAVKTPFKFSPNKIIFEISMIVTTVPTIGHSSRYPLSLFRKSLIFGCTEFKSHEIVKK